MGRTVLNPALPQFNLPASSYKTDPITSFRFLAGARYLSGAFFGGLGLGFSSDREYGTTLSLSPQIGYRLNKFDVILDYTSNNVANSEPFYINYLGLKTIYYFKSIH